MKVLGSTHGLPLVLLSGLWLSYRALCLFDVIVELHAMDENKCSVTFSFEVKVDLYGKHANFLFCICRGGNYHMNLKILV